MSILIKGMEMPTHCWNCKFHDENDDCVLLKRSCIVVWGEYRRREDCPLIEVPPHGRLIDADAFIKQKTEQICENCDRRRGMKDGKLTKRFVYAIGDAPCRACDTGDMLDYVDDAPTIIPASGGKENE